MSAYASFCLLMLPSLRSSTALCTPGLSHNTTTPSLTPETCLPLTPCPSSSGLEPTHFYTVAFHPSDPNTIYAGAADFRGVVSEDGGDTWRVLDSQRNTGANSIYGFAFDPAVATRVFIAAAKWHDWPAMWYANPLFGECLFSSADL